MALQRGVAMNFSSLLNGTATLLLGPILPLLARRWHLDDAHLGYLPMAQFCGAFLGGVSTTGRLRQGVLLGLSLAGLGALGFAAAPGLVLGCAALVLMGFGVGRGITTLNLLAGREEQPAGRTLALSRLNLFWSLGALLSPVLAGALTPHLALAPLLAGLGVLFLLAMTLYAVQPREIFRDAAAASGGGGTNGLPRDTYLLYLAQLFLYGGLETCAAVWLTTFALRYGGDSLRLSESTTVLLLGGLTAGRALAPPLLRRFGDAALQRAGLLLAAAVTAGLLVSHGMAIITVLAVLLGLVLSPVFPSTFARLMTWSPSARAAGVILAASGLGASAFPWVMGQISTRTGGLQRALVVPIVLALVLVVLTGLPAGGSAEDVEDAA